MAAQPYVPDGASIAALRKAATAYQAAISIVTPLRSSSQPAVGMRRSYWSGNSRVTSRTGGENRLSGRRVSCWTVRSRRRARPRLAYLTNAVKHFKFRPARQGKRRIHEKPGRTEILACRPWLRAGFRLLRLAWWWRWSRSPRRRSPARRSGDEEPRTDPGLASASRNTGRLPDH